MRLQIGQWKPPKLKCKEEKKGERTIAKLQQNIQETRDNFKRCNKGIMKIPEGEERGKRKEMFEEIMNYPK